MSKKLKAKVVKPVVRLNPNDYDGARNENRHMNSRFNHTACGEYSCLSDDDDYFQE